MALKLSQSLRQSQNLMMTPQLQQAIKLLTLTHVEISNLISEELVENPLLEEVHDENYQNTQEGDEVSDSDRQSNQQIEDYQTEATSDHFASETVVPKDDFDWQNYVDSFNTSSSEAPNVREELDSDEAPNYENIVTRGGNLADHLEWQLRMEDLSNLERQIGDVIINNLDPSGYLEVDLVELGKMAKRPPSEVDEIRILIQTLDPVGCASFDLTDCLLSQAKIFENRSPLIENIIRNHLGELQRRDYQKISKMTGASLQSIQLAESAIQEFHPRPGRLINSDDTQYVTPDIYVKKVGGEFIVQVNDDGIPRLRVSKLYQDMLGKKSDKAAKEYVQEKIKAAMWLIKSIQNRQKTIVRVAKAIVRRQQDFFQKGAKYLRPMILKDVAEEIGMHESTVSRVTTNKFLYSPLGVFELKYFFNSGVGGKGGSDDVSSEVLKLKIQKLIDSENPKKPFSDQKIVALLDRENIKLARRTVTKYREVLGIDSSSKRKKIS